MLGIAEKIQETLPGGGNKEETFPNAADGILSESGNERTAYQDEVLIKQSKSKEDTQDETLQVKEAMLAMSNPGANQSSKDVNQDGLAVSEKMKQNNPFDPELNSKENSQENNQQESSKNDIFQMISSEKSQKNVAEENNKKDENPKSPPKAVSPEKSKPQISGESSKKQIESSPSNKDVNDKGDSSKLGTAEIITSLSTKNVDKSDSQSKIKDSSSKPTYDSVFLSKSKDDEPPEDDYEDYTKKKTKPEKEEGELPGQLNQVVYHSQESLVYKVLTQQTIPPITDEVKKSVITDLNSYVNLCLQKNLISEAKYIQNLIVHFRPLKPICFPTSDLKQVEENIQFSKSELDSLEVFWNNERELLDRDYQCAVQELDSKLETQLGNLDMEWQNPDKVRPYSKPSKHILNLRYIAQRMILGKNLTGVEYIGDEIKELQDFEATEAAKKMNQDYLRANDQVYFQYQKDLKTLEERYYSNLASMEAQREQSLRSSKKRLEKDTLKKNQMLSMVKNVGKGATYRSVNPQTRSNEVFKGLYDHPKLYVPALQPLAKRNPKRVGSASRNSVGKLP